MSESYTEYDFNPNTLPRDLLEAIGLMTATAAATEYTVEEAIAGCLGVDFEYGKAVTTHMAMPLRFSALRAAAEIRIDDLDALDELDELLIQIEDAFTRRNAIVHHSWCRDPMTDATFIVKETARVRVQSDLIPMSVDQVKADALFMYEADLALNRFLMAHGLLPSFPPLTRTRGHKSKAARAARRKRNLGI
jgi:hypothetical protein